MLILTYRNVFFLFPNQLYESRHGYCGLNILIQRSSLWAVTLVGRLEVRLPGIDF